MALGILLLAGTAGLLADCSSNDPLERMPEYAPNGPFLEWQESNRGRAEEVRRKKNKEIAENTSLGRQRSYRKWEPINRRIEDSRSGRPPAR